MKFITLGKILLLGWANVLLFTKTIICMNFKLTYASGVTEVLSRHENSVEAHSASVNTDEILEDERMKKCKAGINFIEQDKTKSVQFLKDVKVEELKEYLVEALNDDGWVVSVGMVPAFKCPTYPAVYVVHTPVAYKNKEVVLILKKIYSSFRLDDIKSFQLRFVKNLTEAYADQIRAPKPQKFESSEIEKNELTKQQLHKLHRKSVYSMIVESSVVDTDELSEEQRHKMCRKAVHLVSEMEITPVENMPIGRSKYYVLITEQIMSEEDSSLISESSNDGSNRRGIVQAFSCPTRPQIYVHINENEDDDQILWVILEEKEEKPMFDVFGYEVRPVMDVIEDDVLTWNENDLSKARQFTVDFDQLGESAQRKMCQKAIRATFGMSVELLEGAEIEKSKLYIVRTGKNPVVDDGIAQGFQCPTSSALVYVHIRKGRINTGNTCWIFIKKDEHFNSLSVWT